MDNRKHPTGLHGWIVRHDESPLFVVAYITLAVVLTVWISLFWLVAVIAVHALFELIRQATHYRSIQRVLGEAAWEIKLDVALILFALALALYMDLILGMLGLQSAVRMGAAAKAGGRFLVWERVIHGIALSIDDVFNAGRFIRPMMKAVRNTSDGPPAGKATTDDGRPDVGSSASDGPSVLTAPAPPTWTQPWRWGDRFSVGFGLVCLALILMCPMLTEHTAQTILTTFAAELQPFPGR